MHTHPEYESLKSRLASGWNTWNTRSVLSHVLLPEAFALNLAIKEHRGGQYLKESLIGRHGDANEKIHPGPKRYDGSYSELNLRWRGIELRIQTATATTPDGADLVLLTTPLANQRMPATLVVESAILWNRSGYITKDGPTLTAYLPQRTIGVFATTPHIDSPNVATQTPYLALSLAQPVGVSTGTPRTVEQIRAIIDQRRAELMASHQKYGELAEVHAAMQTCMAWDTIYDPGKKRVITPVSRQWNINWGGYVLFCWDNYFAAYLASLDNKELAYANAIEMTAEMTPQGFVPNFAAANGQSSWDRSQPPVGSRIVRELYKRFRDKWLLEMLFEDLLRWNHWWLANRVNDGLLSWGSNPFDGTTGNEWETHGVNDRFGGALESGLDNSPMYDDIPFDKQRHVLELQDVGLTGLYIMDCDALADIATVLGRSSEAHELRDRAERFRKAMDALWDEQAGIFCNRRSDTGAFAHRYSPTNFYALMGLAATDAQAKRMIDEHFYNDREFWGQYIMPSIARNDLAYPEQNYWRGRIWAPMNFLVYLGLRNYPLPQARADLAGKSAELLLKEWRQHGHVHENYNGTTGEGCDVATSDAFYHWGGLLGLIPLIEAGHVPAPEAPL